ncbi:MAG: S-adenosylmethionine:tRNA ribosyltransferase-isomerase [Bacteroidota bacterium]
MNDVIDINEYTYDLPADRIALHPLAQRDQSKLLVYRDGKIDHTKFSQIIDLLEDNSLLVMNNTRVIPARLKFRKPSGAAIEIFLLNPIQPSTLVQEAMIARGSSTWQCTIGNVKRWTNGTALDLDDLHAELIDKERSVVKFTWTSNLTFAEIIERSGQTPLPPYLKRDAGADDKNRYQTVYAKHEGAVAAPTAGLHFTDEILQKLKAKDIIPSWVTLHVGAGTFMPVKTQNALEHTMHEEQVVVTRDLIEQLLSGRRIVAVGTTSLRVLESIYWYGCKLEQDRNAEFVISQNDPYQSVKTIETKKSLQNVLETSFPLAGKTSIYIHPGYRFHLCDALITNFHQPGSTLMLLVAAFVGADWKNVYQQALHNNYRFLSYGDSSLLFR